MVDLCLLILLDVDRRRAKLCDLWFINAQHSIDDRRIMSTFRDTAGNIMKWTVADMGGGKGGRPLPPVGGGRPYWPDQFLHKRKK